jgi:N4-gp56 family major capsid protein
MSNNTTNNSELFAPLVTQAEFAAYENSVARQIVTVFDAPLNTGKILQVPVWASITAQNITDESAATVINTNTTKADITLSEFVVYHQVTDMLRDSAYYDVMAQLGDQSGRAVAEGMDKQVFDLFPSFTQSVGSTGAEVTVDSILQAAATLRSNKLTGPFFAVLHPKVAYNIKKQLTYSSQTNVPALSMVGDSVLSAFYIGQIGGVTIIESSLLNIDTDNDSVGAVFARSALGHAMRGGITMEATRQSMNRATDVTLTAVAGAQILQAAHGVKIIGDAAL